MSMASRWPLQGCGSEHWKSSKRQMATSLGPQAVIYVPFLISLCGSLSLCLVSLILFFSLPLLLFFMCICFFLLPAGFLCLSLVSAPLQLCLAARVPKSVDSYPRAPSATRHHLQRNPEEQGTISCTLPQSPKPKRIRTSVRIWYNALTIYIIYIQ